MPTWANVKRLGRRVKKRLRTKLNKRTVKK
jgi:hypothetical protein